MKIYNWRSFWWGIVFLCPLPLFALGVMEADLGQWILSLALGIKFLYTGLSKEESARQGRIEANYRAVSRQLFGKYAVIKTNLPWILAGSFFTVALFVRFALDVVIPVWVVGCFAMALTVSVFYSIGLNREITEHIDQNSEQNSDP